MFESETALIVQGVDVNSANADAIASMEGMSRYAAERLVDERGLNGLYFALCDLARVPSLEYGAFEQVTGLPWSEDLYRKMRTANKVLGKWSGSEPNLNDVVERFKMLEGFEACVVIHIDGYLLASSWDKEKSEKLSAMGPQIVKNVNRYMEDVLPNNVISVTTFLEGRSLTFIQQGIILFVAIHAIDGVTRQHIQTVNSVGLVLGMLFDQNKA